MTKTTMMKLNRNLLYDAVRIRMVEEKVIELYPSDLIQSPVHLSIGQESVAIGLCANLSLEDWLFINYRSHAFFLAKGGCLKGFFSELMGRKNGVCGGKGGSMHLASPEHGVIGASAVVGSTISHAVGAALAAKIKGENRLFVSVFGDGATEQGALHESMNLAALWQVPVVFLCEDNDLAVHAFKRERQSYNLETLVGAYGIPYFYEGNGYDLSQVYATCAQAINLCKKNRSPVFLHLRTARYNEHVGPGEDFNYGYRSKQNLAQWMESDPLFSSATLNANIISKIQQEIDECVAYAISSPFPNEMDLMTDV